MQPAPSKLGSHPRRGNGFSLLEMMAVISIIMILATFAMPMYRTIVVRAREAVLREDLFTMRSQIDRFTHDYERGPASMQELVDKGYLGILPKDPFTGSNETWQVETATGSAQPSDELKITSLAPEDSLPLGIVDVHSGSPDVSLNGTAYDSW